uniref:FERM domain-containing protein 6-like isoform X2 n=1 Tax=Geotrypetes seraphini TaxID=260995 RepID=A0A6P8QUI5_GEOSA|nr:FERM domain-containing protein 6-like isoform X2 [Geotrypetes seraphini]
MPEHGKRIVCVLLPNRKQLRITVEMKATGRELFIKVCDLMQIRDSHFFGLSVVKNNEYIFMDLEQKLSKYFTKKWKQEGNFGTDKFRPPFLAFFRVQYYVENGTIISKTARHLYYCSLKDQILRSCCTHREEVYFFLAAYGLQADLGNYKKNVHVGRYFEPESYFPQWVIAKRGTEYILRHTPEIHGEQQGFTVKKAVLKFIKDSCLLEDVPIHYYRLHKDKKETCQTVVLGLTLRGIRIYQDVNHVRQLLYDFHWSTIRKFTFLGKKFIIQSDDLPSAQKLVYYTGCPFRSRYLLQLLSNSHRFHLNVQPIMMQIRKREDAEEKECYREVYISDTFEMGIDQLDKHSHKSGSNKDGVQNDCLFQQSTDKHISSYSSGRDTSSRQQMSVEHTFRMDHAYQKEKSCYSTIGHWSLQINSCWKDRLANDVQYDEIELSVDEPEEVLVDDPWDFTQIKDAVDEKSVDSSVLDEEFWEEVVLSVDEPDEFLVDNPWRNIQIKVTLEENAADSCDLI